MYSNILAGNSIIIWTLIDACIRKSTYKYLMKALCGNWKNSSEMPFCRLIPLHLKCVLERHVQPVGQLFFGRSAGDLSADGVSCLFTSESADEVSISRVIQSATAKAALLFGKFMFAAFRHFFCEKSAFFYLVEIIIKQHANLKKKNEISHAYQITKYR